jgi:RHS repeat-associated protein
LCRELATITRYADGSFTTVVSTTTFGYDDVGNMTSQVDKDGSGVTLVGYVDTFDGFDRISSEARTDSLGTVTTPYTYDANSEVASDGTTSYTDDPNGNRTSGGSTVGTDNELSSDGTWNYTYDVVGNMTSKTRISDSRYWAYSYDNRNQMTQAVEYDIEGGSVLRTVDYTYDVFGNMLSRTMTPATGPAETTRFAYDLTSHGSGTTENANGLWAELDGSNALQTRYLNGDGGEHLARTGPTASTAYFLTDRLGSVRELVDLTGAVVYSVSYDAFGNIASESGSVDLGNVMFAGYWYDGDTGLYSAHWRWYNPTSGQWTTEDPIEIEAGDANFRRYVGNNGTNTIDPNGLKGVSYEIAKMLLEYETVTTKDNVNAYTKWRVDAVGEISQYKKEFDAKFPGYTFEVRVFRRNPKFQGSFLDVSGLTANSYIDKDKRQIKGRIKFVEGISSLLLNEKIVKIKDGGGKDGEGTPIDTFISNSPPGSKQDTGGCCVNVALKAGYIYDWIAQDRDLQGDIKVTRMVILNPPDAMKILHNQKFFSDVTLDLKTNYEYGDVIAIYAIPGPTVKDKPTELMHAMRMVPKTLKEADSLASGFGALIGGYPYKQQLQLHPVDKNPVEKPR